MKALASGIRWQATRTGTWPVGQASSCLPARSSPWAPAAMLLRLTVLLRVIPLFRRQAAPCPKRARAAPDSPPPLPLSWFLHEPQFLEKHPFLQQHNRSLRTALCRQLKAQATIPQLIPASRPRMSPSWWLRKHQFSRAHRSQQERNSHLPTALFSQLTVQPPPNPACPLHMERSLRPQRCQSLQARQSPSQDFSQASRTARCLQVRVKVTPPSRPRHGSRHPGNRTPCHCIIPTIWIMMAVMILRMADLPRW